MILKATIKAGTVHKLSEDFISALKQNDKILAKWNNLTPLARNEWICWIISVKQESTRQQHIKRAIKELSEGKRRPCCWIGCIHRTDKAISPSVKYILSKRRKK